jgi:hypothetical protein
MSNNAPNGISIVLGVVVAMAIVAVLFLQTLSKTTVKDDYDLPPVNRRSDRTQRIQNEPRRSDGIFGPTTWLMLHCCTRGFDMFEMLDLFIGFVVGCAIGYFAREMLSRYRRERVRRERLEQRDDWNR